VHLNYGDRGLCTLLRRIHKVLKPGGRMLLIAQPWSSYAKHRALTSHIAATYRGLRMHPRDILSYLLDRVGFTALERVVAVRSPTGGRTKELIILRK